MAVKKILNLHEEATHIKLKKICEEYGTSVYPKLRVADVLPIQKSGISSEEYRFALQSHFDFVVADSEHTPVFAVEFDGPTHTSPAQKKRDNKKDNLCDQFEFPILRINAKHLIKKYRNYDLLTWFIEMWFLQESFYEAQKNGHIPWDEPFDALSIGSMSGKNEMFPLWLSKNVRAHIQSLAKQHKYIDFTSLEWIGIDKDDNYHGISWLLIDDKRGVYTQAIMRNKRFPIVVSDVLSDILAFQLYEELLQFQQNKARPKNKDYINSVINSYNNKYEMRACSGISRTKKDITTTCT